MARGGREKRCVLRSQQSARIRDRSDHHRCLYCDDVPPNGRIVTALFAGALFLSAFLLFVLEPTVATSILPTLGGIPMAWNTRLVALRSWTLLRPRRRAMTGSRGLSARFG